MPSLNKKSEQLRVKGQLISFDDDLGNATYSQYVGLTGLVVKVSREKKHFDDKWKIIDPSTSEYREANYISVYDYAVIVRLLKLTPRGSTVHTLMVPAACLEVHEKANNRPTSIAAGVFSVGGWAA